MIPQLITFRNCFEVLSEEVDPSQVSTKICSMEDDVGLSTEMTPAEDSGLSYPHSDFWKMRRFGKRKSFWSFAMAFLIFEGVLVVLLPQRRKEKLVKSSCGRFKNGFSSRREKPMKRSVWMEKLHGRFWKLRRPSTTGRPEMAMARRAKGKTGGKKGKGSKGKADSLPRLDLLRFFPKKEVTSWQAVSKALEEVEEPRGNICICRSAQQMLEFQELAAALGLKRKVIVMFVCKHLDGDEEVPGSKVMLLPVMGNLAMLRCTVAMLDKSQAQIEEDEIVETHVKAPPQTTTLRIMLPLKYIPRDEHAQLYGKLERP